jgi:hypothetical protein
MAIVAPMGGNLGTPPISNRVRSAAVALPFGLLTAAGGIAVNTVIAAINRSPWVRRWLLLREQMLAASGHVRSLVI